MPPSRSAVRSPNSPLPRSAPGRWCSSFIIARDDLRIAMRLIFIYGAPAAGKLTVARELAALTGFALFHNHLVVDAVASVFPFGSESFSKLREQWWLAMMGEAAAA